MPSLRRGRSKHTRVQRKAEGIIKRFGYKMTHKNTLKGRASPGTQTGGGCDMLPSVAAETRGWVILNSKAKHLHFSEITASQDGLDWKGPSRSSNSIPAMGRETFH